MTILYFSLVAFSGWQFASMIDKKKTKEQKQAHIGKFTAGLIAIIITRVMLG